MPTYQTPGVYIEEISVFPPSVAEVETAIPAFVGHTERAMRLRAGDLANRPTKIFSFAEYEQHYGGPATPEVTVALTTAGTAFTGDVTVADSPYRLWYAVKMYFDNGGGKCYIVSAGDYATAPAGDAFTAAFALVAQEDEPTLLVCPEAVGLDDAGYASVAQAMLQQCGTLGDRFAILDAFGGGAALDNDGLEAAREAVGNNHLRHGALYYPFLESSFTPAVAADESNVDVTLDGGEALTLAALGEPGGDDQNTALYNAAKAALRSVFVTVPPSGAVAGVYAATDTARGVWKAPANVSLADVVRPVVALDNARQDGLNIDATTGKSINAIRAFAGKGTLVWGARTLAGNDNEWRYVPVRRFFTMVEESVKKSTYWAVFEPNDANTWVKVRGMIENYLTQKWREGALAGATTKDAFFVRCGLGTTMNSQDILEGRMNVEIGMAAVRPAEFIVLKFSHKLQAS